jgi:hypothetical protein
MSRWLEEIGAIMGATIVEAMRKEALASAFCIATDATGVLVQPIPRPDEKRQPCRRAHFFVQIADADHVFFEYTPVETSAVVRELFRGYSGFVQADAKSVYDVLYHLPNEHDRVDDDPPDLAVRYEVGCWSHARTKLWEAAVATQDPIAREGLARIMRMFQLERLWKPHSPDERKALRDRHLRPHVIAFFAFAEEAYERVKHQRGLLRSALGYSVRQKDALMRFFDDGRLEMTNNHSERQRRKVACGRKAWLFVGSDDHGQAAGNLLTLIASARLHKLDPELYLHDVFRVLPHWPRDRSLELAPRYWSATRARLDPQELDQELGPLNVPEPALPTATVSPVPAELRPRHRRDLPYHAAEFKYGDLAPDTVGIATRAGCGPGLSHRAHMLAGGIYERTSGAAAQPLAGRSKQREIRRVKAASVPAGQSFGWGRGICVYTPEKNLTHSHQLSEVKETSLAAAARPMILWLQCRHPPGRGWSVLAPSYGMFLYALHLLHAAIHTATGTTPGRPVQSRRRRKAASLS